MHDVGMVATKMLFAGKALERRYTEERQQRRESGAFEQLTCVCRQDKVVVTASAFAAEAIRRIPGFRLRRIYPVKPQRPGDFVPYQWVARITGTGSIREVVISYDRQARWLAPSRVIIIARDRLGLQFADVCSIFELLADPKIIDVELAFDFPIACIVDVNYVEQYGVFGRSQPRNVSRNPLYSNYGRRVGSKFVRSYAKVEMSCHRVEFGFHLLDLKRFRIKSIFDFHKFIDILPRHILFAQLSKQKLLQQLRRKGFSAKKQQKILRGVKALQGNLCQTLRYLRRTARLKNTRRLLVPLDEVNRVVLEALKKWSAEWSARHPAKGLTPPPIGTFTAQQAHENEESQKETKKEIKNGRR
jgi:hypothetical protein